MKKSNVLLLISIVFTFIGQNGQSQTLLPQAIGLLPANYYVTGLSAVNDSVCWAVASQYNLPIPVPANHIPSLLRTTNGGNTWTVVEIEEIKGRLSWDIQASSATEAWITAQDYGSGLGRALWKTTDGGATWTEAHVYRGCGVYLRLLEDGHIFAQGNRYTARTDADGMWVHDTLDAYFADEFNVVYSAANMAETIGDTIWVGTTYGRVMRFKNYGADLEVVGTGIPTGKIIQSIAFADHLNGLVSFQGGMARTSDGGTNWTVLPAPDPFMDFNITHVKGTAGTFVAVSDFTFEPSMIAWTFDNGSTWQTAAGEHPSNAVAFNSANSGWVSGGVLDKANNTAVYRWNGGALVGLPTFSAVLGFDLSPNPTVDAVKISLKLAKKCDFQLLIHDENGRLAKIAAFEKTQETTHSFDLKGLAAGVYTVSVRSAEGVLAKQIVKVD